MSFDFRKLGSLCTVKTGKKDVNEGNPDGVYPFFTCATEHTFSDTFSFDCEAILVAGNGAVGQTSYYNGKFEAYQRTYVLCDFVDVIPKYLLHVLNGRLIGELSSKVLGNTIPYIKKGMLTDFDVPVPPIKIQQKIVKKLDVIFAEIDEIIADTEANIKNAEALFQSYLTEIFETNLYKTVLLKDCCLIRPPKSESKRLASSDLVSFMPMESLGINKKYAVANQEKTLSEVSGSYTYFSEDDVLLAKITPCFENGKLGIAKDLVNGVGFGSSEYIVLRPNSSISSEWLYYYLNRDNFRLMGSRNMSGAVGHKRVTKEFIDASLLPVPTIQKQAELVGCIDKIQENTLSLKSSGKNKLKELNSLKQAILRYAFSGKLIKE